MTESVLGDSKKFPNFEKLYIGEVLTTTVGSGLNPDASIQVVDPSAGEDINDAIDNVSDGRGDFILVKPGSHNAAGTIACNKKGMTIIAAQFGHPDPFKGESFMLRTSSDYATVPGVTVTKPVRIVGMGITGRDTDKQSLLVDCLEAGGFSGGFNSFEFCRFPAWYGAMDTFVTLIGGSVNIFHRCTFDGLFGGITTAAIQVENDTGAFATDFLRVEGCEFSGIGSSKPAIKCKTGSVPLDMFIYRNRLLPGFSGNPGVMVDFNSVAATGMAAENFVAPLANQAAAFLNTGSLAQFGFANNHYEE